MRPARVELLRVAVPMRVAHRSAVADQEVRESILVRVCSEDGVEGEAECPTLSGDGYVTESTASAWAALTGELAVAALAGTVATERAAPAASAALADAILDAELRRAGVPLARWLADLTALPNGPSVPWTAVIADGAARLPGGGDSIASAAAGAVADGRVDAQGEAERALECRANRVQRFDQPSMCRSPWTRTARYARSIWPESTTSGWPISSNPCRPGLRGPPLPRPPPAVQPRSVWTSPWCRWMPSTMPCGPGRWGWRTSSPPASGAPSQRPGPWRCVTAAGVDCFVGACSSWASAVPTALAVASLRGCTCRATSGRRDRYFGRREPSLSHWTAGGRCWFPDGWGRQRAPVPSGSRPGGALPGRPRREQWTGA